MANEFIARKGLIALADSQITGSLNLTGNVTTIGTISGEFASSTGTAISGAFTSTSESIASDISTNSASIASLEAASGSYLLNTTDTFTGDLTVTGEVIAQTLNVQQVTSSIVYSSGSNIFGNSVSNTQDFTGSLQVSGSSHYLLGDVGIGTTSPVSKLETKDGDIRVTTLNSFSKFKSGRASIPNSVGFNLGGILFQAYSTGTTYTTGTAIESYSDREAWTSTSTPSYLSFQTVPSGSTSLSERMRIDSNGNVGIGTTSSFSNAELDVWGDIVLAQQNWALRGNAGNANFAIEELSGGAFNDNNVRLEIATGGNIGINTGTSTPTDILDVRPNANSSYASNSVDAVRIGRTAAGRPSISFDTSDTTFTNRVWYIENYGASGSLIIGRNGLDVLNLKENADVLITGGWNPGNPSRLVVRGEGDYNNTFSRAGSTLQIISDELTDNAWSPVLNITNVRQSLTTGKDSFGGIGFSSIDDSNNSGMTDAARIALVNESPNAVITPTSLAFYTNAGTATTGSATERMRIDSSGAIGINKSTGFADGGFGEPKLIIKQSANSQYGGILLEASGNDAIFSLGTSEDAHYITGTYRTTAGYKPIIFSLAGGEKMRISTGGTVSITSGSPSSIASSAKLQLGEPLNAGSSAIFQANGFVRIEHGLLIHWDSDNTQAGYLQYSGTNGFLFTTEGDGSGNVGIGINPSAKLHVDGGGGAGPWVKFEGGGSVFDNTALELHDTGTSSGNTNNLVFKGASANIAKIKVTTNGNNAVNGGHMDFITYSNAGSSENNPVRITNQGDLSVGTTTTKKKLTVYGGNDNGIWIDSQGAQYTTLALGNNGSEKANISWDNTNTKLGIIAYGSSGINLTTNSVSRLLIDSNGMFSTKNSHSEHSLTRHYTWQGSGIGNGAVIDLIENASSYTDVTFIAFIEVFHSSRTYRTIMGTFGGYGYNATSSGNGLAALQQTGTGTGTAKLQFNNSSGYEASAYIHLIIVGDASITVHNGYLSSSPTA